MAYNLQGIVRKSTVNITTEFDRLAYSAQNLANINTTAYKAVRFDDIIDADGSVHGYESTDTTSGEFYLTKNPLDVAIQGAGYIPVTSPSGEIKYTRDGSFTVNKDGLLVTKNGDLVGSGIYIDGTAEKTEIRPNGDVYSYKRLMDEPEYVGTIPVVQFQNPQALKDVGANEYVATDEAGNVKLVEDHTRIKQYGTERANVNIMDEILTVSRINASILASAKLMKTVNTMYQEAINLTQ